jgi:hypothetical protein
VTDFLMDSLINVGSIRTWQSGCVTVCVLFVLVRFVACRRLVYASSALVSHSFPSESLDLSYPCWRPRFVSSSAHLRVVLIRRMSFSSSLSFVEVGLPSDVRTHQCVFNFCRRRHIKRNARCIAWRSCTVRICVLCPRFALRRCALALRTYSVAH